VLFTGQIQNCKAIIFMHLYPKQFDEYIWFDQTLAVTPTTKPRKAKAGEEETFPFGV
jgi:hypothetical protein